MPRVAGPGRTADDNKQYRKRQIRFSFLEDSYHRVLEKIEDPQARMEIYKELSTLIAQQKVLVKK